MRQLRSHGMSDLPVACTLGPAALAARPEGLFAELLRRADVHDAIANGHRLVFRAPSETLALVMKTVEMESQCCKFLRFQITVEPGAGPMAVELTGPPGTREFLSALFES